MNTLKINHLAVWVLVVAFQILSSVWYSPLLFANKWMGYLGKRFEDFNGESVSGIVFALIGAITFCYFLAWLFTRLKIEDPLKGLGIGCLIALCCFVFQTFTQDRFSLRPIGLSFINGGIILINFAIAGLVIGGWRKYRK